MSLIKKMPLVVGGAVSLLGTATQVSADTTHQATTTGTGGNVGSTTSTQDQQLAKSNLNQLLTNYSSIVTQTDDQTSASDFNTHSRPINTTLAETNDLVQKIQSQKDTALRNGYSISEEPTQTINYDQLKNGSKDWYTDLLDTYETNKNILASGGGGVTNYKQLQNAVDNANSIIKNEITNNLLSTDGIKGRLDILHGAINTSLDKTGSRDVFTVDMNQTNQTNQTQVDYSILGTTKVSNVGQVNSTLDQILQEIKNTSGENAAELARQYSERALKNTNYVAINVKQLAENANEAIKSQQDSMVAPQTMDAYKTKYLAQLQELKTQVQNGRGSDKSKAKMTAMIDEAIADLNNSNVNIIDATGKTADTTPKTITKDLGNIGQEEAVIRGAIDALKAEVQGQINEALQKSAASNQAAMTRITPQINTNSELLDNFIRKVKAGGGGAQVDADFLNSLELYRNNSTYREYVDKAIAQTESDISNLLNNAKTIGNTTVWTVPDNTSVASASAAMYAMKSENGFEDGYGSTMLSDGNINNFVKVSSPNMVLGGADAAKQWNELRQLTNYLNGSGLPNYGLDQSYTPTMYDLDIKAQHIDSGSPTFLYVSTNPTFSMDLGETFVYLDENGNPNKANQKLNITITAGDGSRFEDGHFTSVYEGGQGEFLGNPYYLIWGHVDPTSGQLVLGGGVIATGNGSGGTTTGVAGPVAVEGGGGGGGSVTGDGSLGSGDRKPKQVWTSGADEKLYPKGVGLSFQLETDSKASAWSQYAPLYISDIDDEQTLTLPANQMRDVIVAQSNSSRISGTNNLIVTSTEDHQIGNRATVLSSESILVFGSDGGDGLTMEYGTIGKTQPGYSALDIRLFAPFGVIGAPTLDIEPIVDEVQYTTINDPKVTAHTELTSQISSKIKFLEPERDPFNKNITIKSVNFELPTITDGTTKKTSAQTSMILKQVTKDAKRVASGNSLIVTNTSGNQKVVSSGNSLVIKRVMSQPKRAASSNSLVLQQITQAPKKVASSNSLILQQLTKQVDTQQIDEGSIGESQEPRRIERTTTPSSLDERLAILKARTQ